MPLTRSTPGRGARSPLGRLAELGMRLAAAGDRFPGGLPQGSPVSEEELRAELGTGEEATE